VRVTVLTGGASAERDVALASAAQVVAALRQRGHAVAAVDLARGSISAADERLLLSGAVGAAPPPTGDLDAAERRLLLSGLDQLPEVGAAEVLFLALHGGRGEDGTVQAVLDLVGVPYTGSGPVGTALAMDKDVSKRLFGLAGIPTPDWVMAPVGAAAAGARLGWPLIVKPSKQGSTVGLSLVKSAADFDAAVALAAQYDDEVLVEAFVPGRELTVGVLDGEALAVGEILPRHELFDYECKYQPGMAEEVFPADLPAPLEADCRRLALAAHRALKLGGYSRADFRLTPDGRLCCLEVNTLPGLTATSLLPQSARARGIGFGDLCERICQVARRTGRA
jgi:D-alanine-D-alanine ligase